MEIEKIASNGCIELKLLNDEKLVAQLTVTIEDGDYEDDPVGVSLYRYNNDKYTQFDEYESSYEDFIHETPCSDPYFLSVQELTNVWNMNGHAVGIFIETSPEGKTGILLLAWLRDREGHTNWCSEIGSFQDPQEIPKKILCGDLPIPIVFAKKIKNGFSVIEENGFFESQIASLKYEESDYPYFNESSELWLYHNKSYNLLTEYPEEPENIIREYTSQKIPYWLPDKDAQKLNSKKKDSIKALYIPISDEPEIGYVLVVADTSEVDCYSLKYEAEYNGFKEEDYI